VHRQSVEPIYESLRSLPQPPAATAGQSGNVADDVAVGGVRGGAPLQRSPAVQMGVSTRDPDIEAQIQICQGMAKTLEDFSKTVREQCHLVSSSSTSASKEKPSYQEAVTSDEAGGYERVGRPSDETVGKSEQQQQQQPNTNSGFTRRNSKKISYQSKGITPHNGNGYQSVQSRNQYQDVVYTNVGSSTQGSNDAKSLYSNVGGVTKTGSPRSAPKRTAVERFGSDRNDQVVYTKTTTLVEVSQPQVTVTEKVLTSKVTNMVPPPDSALNLLASSLPFIDDQSVATTPPTTHNTLKSKLRSLDREMEAVADDDLFVDAHDNSIDAAIAEAAGVDDNNDKIVESIQITRQQAKARQDSIKDSRSS